MEKRTKWGICIGKCLLFLEKFGYNNKIKESYLFYFDSNYLEEMFKAVLAYVPKIREICEK